MGSRGDHDIIERLLILVGILYILFKVVLVVFRIVYKIYAFIKSTFNKLLSIIEWLRFFSARKHYKRFEKEGLSEQASDKQDEQRRTMMSHFLSAKGWSESDISQLLASPYLLRDDNGWLIPQQELDGWLEIAELKGFVLDYNESSPSVKLIFKPAKVKNGLLSFDDVLTVFKLDQEEVHPISFSLDSPSTTEHYHPFALMESKPYKLQKSRFMQTLFHADYLLKFLSSGMEVSANPPFDLRPILHNLSKHLPHDLLHAVRPPYLRKSKFNLPMKSGSLRHRLWIETEKLCYDEDFSKSESTYFIDSVRMVVFCRKMEYNSNGHLQDTLGSDDRFTQFAEDLTSNYCELSKYFPILARLRELSKLQFMQSMILKQLTLLKKKSSSQYRAFNKEFKRLRSLAPLKKCTSSSCTWVPSTYLLCKKCKCWHRGVYGGVLMKPLYEQCIKAANGSYVCKSYTSTKSCKDRGFYCPPYQQNTCPRQSPMVLDNKSPSHSEKWLPLSHEVYASSGGRLGDISSLPSTPYTFSDAQNLANSPQTFKTATLLSMDPNSYEAGVRFNVEAECRVPVHMDTNSLVCVKLESLSKLEYISTCLRGKKQADEASVTNSNETTTTPLQRVAEDEGTCILDRMHFLQNKYFK